MKNFRKRTFWMTPQGVFHWLNAICIVCLLLLGTIMMFREDLGFNSIESKIALKRIHSYIGFLFLTNLIARGVAGYFKRSLRTSEKKRSALFQYLSNTASSRATPITEIQAGSQLVSLLIFAVLILSAATGLFRTSTDLYYPPLGPFVARWIATSPEVAPHLNPMTQDHVDQSKLSKLNRVKVPVGFVHKWSAITLILLIVLHVKLVHDLSRRRTNATEP